MKKVFKIAIIWALTVIIIQIEKEFKGNENRIFDVTEVEITGNISENLGKDLEKIKKGLIGESVHDIDLRRLKEKILSDVRIDKVEIEEKDINKLRIDITEKKGLYYLQYKDNIYISDKNGEIFGRIEEYPRKSIPVLYIDDEKNKEELVKIAEKLEDFDFKDYISQIYIENKNTVIILLRDGTKLKTNLETVKQRYLITFSLYKELKKTKELEYIDMRFKDIVIKEKEGKDARKYQ